MALMTRKNVLILTVTDNRKGIIRKPIYGHDSLGITGIGPGSLWGPPLVLHATRRSCDSRSNQRSPTRLEERAGYSRKQIAKLYTRGQTRVLKKSRIQFASMRS
jgi:hypothetical protein